MAYPVSEHFTENLFDSLPESVEHGTRLTVGRMAELFGEYVGEVEHDPSDTLDALMGEVSEEALRQFAAILHDAFLYVAVAASTTE